MKYDEVRPKLSAALAPIEDGDPDVHPGFVDSLTPPALVVSWGKLDPPSTACLRTGRVNVTAIVARQNIEQATDDLEQLVAYALNRLAADSFQWPDDGPEEPRQFKVAATQYLAQRIPVRVHVTI